ncbi:hypothetical protein GTY23_14015 [Streptomyces sp. SID5998]|nr:hypothetical protein [Streptomyces sp. SID5998]
MPTITALLPRAVHAPAPAQAPYEDCRPPIHGVSLLVPVGADALVVADLRSLIMLPTGTVSDGQTPEQAARDPLLGAPDGLPALQRVDCVRKRLRRRKVVTHVLATKPMTRETVAQFAYRDPRGLALVRAAVGLSARPEMSRRDRLPDPHRRRPLRASGGEPASARRR